MSAPAWSTDNGHHHGYLQRTAVMNIYRTTSQERTERAAQEAAEWLHVMNAEPGPDEREAFAAWVAASPLHVREMLLASMLDQELAASGVLDDFDLDAILAKADTGANVVALHERQPQASVSKPGRARRARRRRRPWIRAAGLAAVLLLGVAGWMGMHQAAPSGITYATTIGEHRNITLDDGTRVTMAPGSRISVDFSSDLRIIRLRRGEAGFDVVHNASRPFRVYAGSSMIQDVGTRFSVNRLPSGTIVSVTEGRVAVSANHSATDIGDWVKSWLSDDQAAIERPGVKVEPLDKPVTLSAGEAVHISSTGDSLTRGTSAAEREVPVDARRLTFHDDTLEDIAAEFNRYNTQQIVIEGDSVRLQRYSGVFDADDAASFLQFLDCCSRLKVVREGDRMVVRAGSQAPSD